MILNLNNGENGSGEGLSPILKTLKDDFKKIGEMVRAFSLQVIEQGISEYPVYIAHVNEVTVGKPFLSKDQYGLNWNYNATILEDFVNRKIVMRDNVEEFMNTYGDPSERACILIILPEEAGFLFVPFSE